MISPTELAQQTAATKLSFEWLGTRRSFTKEQRSTAASPFQATDKAIAASQKLVDTGHPALKKLTTIKGDIISYWKANTIPYPEEGIRLLPRGKVDEFNATLDKLHQAFLQAARDLRPVWDEIKQAAREELGTLYNDSYYPQDPASEFDFTWSFPSIEPPDYLQQLSPSLYQEAQRQIQAKLSEAVTLHQQAFAEELGKLIAHLREKLSPDKDGKKKIFRDSAVENLREFFVRFKQMNLTNDEQLEAIVNQAKELLGDVSAKELRKDEGLKQQIVADLAAVENALATQITTPARRKIVPLKPTPAKEETETQNDEDAA